MHSQTKAWITDGDPTIIFRVVGFLEYASALRYLDELVRTCSAEELKAIDQLIAERPEFTVLVNRAEPLLTAPSTLIPVDDNPDPARRGLAWVMALARVELAGILATFGAHRDPFSVVAPTQLEWDAYCDLLLDDAEVHFWSLTRDPDLERVAKSTPGTAMLAYVRRLSLSRQLLLAAGISRRNELTPQQAAELTDQFQQLCQARDLFRYAIATFLRSHNADNTVKSTSDLGEIVNACGKQLEKEADALRSGDAFLEQIQPADQTNNPGQNPRQDQNDNQNQGQDDGQ